MHNAVNNSSDSPDFNSLMSIGLTKTQSRCYNLLSEGRSLSASQLAEQLKVSRTGLYPQLMDLHAKGFIKQWRLTAPTLYRSVPLAQALVIYADYQRLQVREIIIWQQQLSD